MNKDELAKYKGQLKYISEKYKSVLKLIDSYISRIDDNTATVMSKDYYEKVIKERDKDLLQEVKFLIKELEHE